MNLNRVIKTGALGILALLVAGISVHAAETVTKREIPKPGDPDKRLINLENPKREQLLQPARVIDVLGVKPGEVLADVGAGTGFFSFRLADRVSIGGKVYAVEIEDKFLAFIREKMAKNGVTNIIPIKSSESDPHLPPMCCDKIILVNTYIHIADPIRFMVNLRKSLKPGGLLAIIDNDPSKNKITNKRKQPTAEDIIKEIQQAGFTLHTTYDFLEHNFFLVFRATE
jgi:protein-L-isoaspartate O-methyltransferase